MNLPKSYLRFVIIVIISLVLFFSFQYFAPDYGLKPDPILIAGATEIIADVQALGWKVAQDADGNIDSTRIFRDDGSVTVSIISKNDIVLALAVTNDVNRQNSDYDNELLDYLKSIVPDYALDAYQQMVRDTVEKDIQIKQILLAGNIRVVTFSQDEFHTVVFESRLIPPTNLPNKKTTPDDVA